MNVSTRKLATRTGVAVMCGQCLLLLANASHALDIHWNGSGGPFGDPQSWQNVDNWDPAGNPFQVHRVPGDSDTATLSTPADDFVRLFGDTAPINGLTINNGIVLDTNGHRLLVDNGGFAGTAVTVIAGEQSRLFVESIDFISPPALITDNLLMSGGGQLVMGGGAAIIEGNTTLLNDALISYSLNFFEPAGDLTFGGDVTIVDSTVEIPDGGRIDFLGAMIRLQQNAEFTSDVNTGIEILNNTTLDVLDSSWNASSTTVRGVMKLRGTSQLGAGWILVDGGTLEIGASALIGNPLGFSAMNQGQVVSEGDLSLSGFTTGTFASGADLVLAEQSLNLVGGGSISFDGNGSTLTAGEVSVVGNFAGSAMELLFSNGALGTVNRIEADSSITQGNLAEGRVVVSSGAMLNVTGEVIVGPNGPGAINVVTGGSMTQSGSGASSVLAGFISASEGGVYTSNNQPILVDANGSLRVEGAAANGIAQSGVMNVHGPLTVKGNLTVLADESVPDDPGGLLYLQAPMTIDGGIAALAGGALTADTIYVTGGGSFDFTGGKLGVATFDGELINQGGTLSPSMTSAGAGIGTTVISGDYGQLVGGTLEIEIGGLDMGADYDTVDVMGTASVAGQLELILLDGFAPQPTDVFVLLSADNVNGFFDGLPTGQRITTLGGEGSFVIGYVAGGMIGPGQVFLSNYLVNLAADFDVDGDVDGADFLAIQRTNPALIPLWQSQYGNGAPLASSQTVPEPNSVVMLLVALVGLVRRTARVRHYNC